VCACVCVCVCVCVAKGSYMISYFDVWQCAAECSSVLQGVAVRFRALQYVTVPTSSQTMAISLSCLIIEYV